MDTTTSSTSAVERVPFSQVRAYAETHDREYAEKWFSRGAMRFFGTRLPKNAWRGPGGTFFVTSEQPPSGARGYTVRMLGPDGRFDTFGGAASHGEHAARTLAHALALNGVRYWIEHNGARIVSRLARIDGSAAASARMILAGRGCARTREECYTASRECSQLQDGLKGEAASLAWKLGHAFVEVASALPEVE